MIDTLYLNVQSVIFYSNKRLYMIIYNIYNTVTASRAFRVAAPTIWNNLPDFVRLADSFNVFKHRLKYQLFGMAF